MLRAKDSHAPTEKLIDFSNKEVFDYITATRSDYIQQRDRSLTEENETERVACSQLMLVTTVLLSATVLVLSNGDVLKSLTGAQKILTVMGVASLIASIFAGVRYYFVLVRFHLDWAKGLNEVVNLHSRVDFKTFKEAGEKTDGILEALPTLTPKRWLKWQIGLLGGGVGAYLLLLIAILFNFDFVTRHIWMWLR